jgi:hypothetical protein
MTHSLRKCIGAGALGAALLAGTLLPAQAAEAPASGIAQAAAQAQSRAYPGESFTQGKIYYGRGGGYRGGYRGGYYGRGYGYRRGYGGGGVAAGVVGGLALGALAGAAIANSQPAPAYGYYGGPGQPVGNVYGADPNWVNYCASKYRSFDPRTGTYLASDGYRYPCQ